MEKCNGKEKLLEIQVKPIDKNGKTIEMVRKSCETDPNLMVYHGPDHHVSKVEQ